MPSTRIEELLEQLVDQNADVINKLDELLTEVREIKEELNWIGETSLAKRIVDGLDAIERSIDSIGT
jgi:uncharacterized protein Yka (UPF0111/DUF47 family)